MPTLLTIFGMQKLLLKYSTMHRGDCAQLACVCYVILNTSVLVALDVACKNKDLKDSRIAVFSNPRKSRLPCHKEKKM